MGASVRIMCKRDRVIDPIADGVLIECAVGNSGRERERRGVQRRQFQMKIDGVMSPGYSGWKLVAFAGGVGAGEVDAQMIAEHEPDNGQAQIDRFARTLIRTTMDDSGSRTGSG